MGWICLLQGQHGRADHTDLQLGNDDSGNTRGCYRLLGPGITTSGAQLQGGTGNVMPVSPLIVQGSKSSSKEPTKNTISYNAFLSSSFVTLQY